MQLALVAIDPGTDGSNCPALFADEETGDLLVQGWTVTDERTLADASRHSPSGQRVRSQAPGPDACDHLGGTQWPRCHRSAT